MFSTDFDDDEEDYPTKLNYYNHTDDELTRYKETNGQENEYEEEYETPNIFWRFHNALLVSIAKVVVYFNKGETNLEPSCQDNES